MAVDYAWAAEPFVASNAPKDRPIREDVAKLEAAVAPYIREARQTYPRAKKRFLAGLPPKHSFFLTTRLYDKLGNMENVFIAVDKISGGTVTGKVWTDLHFFPQLRHGDVYSFPEAELIDWLITKPDGSEEGNFVGKFMDTYRR